MTARLHAQAKELFLRACELDPAGREAFLDRECADAQVRREVAELLAHHQSQTILVAPRRAPEARSSSRLRTRSFLSSPLVTLLVGDGRWRLRVIVALALLTAVAVWIHRGIDQSLRSLRATELETVLAADLAALELWLDEQKQAARAWAMRPDLRGNIVELAKASREKSPAEALRRSPAQAASRETMRQYLQLEGGVGYAVVDRAGLVLAAEDDAHLGQFVNAAGQAQNARAFEGKAVVSRPHPAGKFTGIAAGPMPEPRIWTGVPVRDGKHVVAVLYVAYRADDDFTRILSLARQGASGETYAFDDKGLLLSESRFDEQLRQIGLLPHDAQVRSIFNVQLRDPGGDLTAGYRPPLPLAARPLTHAAALAVAGQDGMDLDGYRDYRGVRVIGAWKWLPEYGFGVTTKMDYAEAYAALWYPRVAGWLLVGLLGASTVGLLAAARRIGRLRREVGEARELGQYTLVEKIGEGGMGVVYRARHAMLRRPTAVKLLKPELVTPDGLARFEQEVQLASQLSHPNTIEIYDYGRTPDGVFYYAMEFLSGLTLAELVARGGPLPSGRAIDLLKQACGSLAEAHALGLVHRDIKPSNIMLCQRGGLPDVVKVLDFGLAKNLQRDEAGAETRPGVLAGTLRYIAPERINDPAQADGRSDMYSLGCVAYELLAGRPLFEGEGIDLLAQALNAPAPRVSQCRQADLPPALDQLVADCLAKDPQQRPTATAMIDALDRVRGAEPWSEEQARAWWRRREEAGEVQPPGLAEPTKASIGSTR